MPDCELCKYNCAVDMDGCDCLCHEEELRGETFEEEFGAAVLYGFGF